MTVQSLNDLPDETIRMITAELPLTDLLSLNNVNQRIRKAIEPAMQEMVGQIEQANKKLQNIMKIKT